MKKNVEVDNETFSADAYSVKGYEGVAWHVRGWDIEQFFEEYSYECPSCGGSGYNETNDQQCRNCDGTGSVHGHEDEPTERRTGMIVARMVGDDRDFVLDAGDIRPIAREDYCGECGQIGCTHDGLERE